MAENIQKIFACIMPPLLITFQGDCALPCRIPSTSLKWAWPSSDLRPGAPTSQQHISCDHANLLTDSHTHRAVLPLYGVSLPTLPHSWSACPSLPTSQVPFFVSSFSSSYFMTFFLLRGLPKNQKRIYIFLIVENLVSVAITL